MDDLISRQWLMECFNEGWIKFDTKKDESRFIHLIRDIAPSEEPELRWRPVSESRNFPKYKNLYCYCWDKKTGGNWAEVLYRSEDGFWCKPTGDVFNYEVLAWYPLPGKAYREREEEK